jgi:hypothetical protein
MLLERLLGALGSRSQGRPLLILGLVYLGQFALYFFVDGARVADEELHTPSVAALLAAGYPMELARLQYTTFCGGCTAETLLVLPLFSVFGPSLALWRLVSLLAGAVILVAAYRFIARVEGQRAAVLTGLLLVLAPPYYRESAIIAFGSHFEVMGLVILALFPWLRLIQEDRRRDAFLLGLTLGLAFWFSYSSAFALPVLLGSWLLWRGRAVFSRAGLTRLAALGAGLVVGIIPLLVTQRVLRRAHILVNEAPLSVYGRSLGDLLAGPPTIPQKLMTLFGPSYWASIFHPTIHADRPTFAVLYAVAQLLVLLLACGWGLRALRAARREAAARPPWLPIAAALLLFYLLLFVLFAPYRGEVPPAAPVPANGLRYLLPTVPLLALCAGPLLTQMWAAAGLRRVLAAALASVLLVTGAVAAVADVQPRYFSTSPLFASAVDYETVLGRTRFTFPPLGDLRPDDVARGLADGAKHRFARRTWLYSLGVNRAEQLGATSDPAAVASFLSILGGLSVGDRITVLEVLVARLGAAPPAPPWGEADARFQGLLDAAGEADRVLLWRALFLAARNSFWDLHLSLSQHKPIPPSHLDPRAGPERISAFCWNLGFMSGIAHRQSTDPAFELAQALIIGSAVPADYHRAFFTGLGRALGERWGFQSGVATQLRDGVPGGHQDAFVESFLGGAEARFLFPVRSL